MSTLNVGTAKVTNYQDQSGIPVTPAKAWVNFNGTGTIAIRASNNVSSIIDNGVGNYIINFTNPMPDANYAAAMSARIDDSAANADFPVCGISRTNGQLAGSLNVYAVTRSFATTASSLSDVDIMTVAIFR